MIRLNMLQQEAELILGDWPNVNWFSVSKPVKEKPKVEYENNIWCSADMDTVNVLQFCYLNTPSD